MPDFPEFLLLHKPIFYKLSMPFQQLRHLYSLVILYQNQNTLLHILRNFLIYHYKKHVMLKSVFEPDQPSPVQFSGGNALDLPQSKPIKNHNIFFRQHPKHIHPLPFPAQPEADDNYERRIYFLFQSKFPILMKGYFQYES
ncbi:hypothetical protein D3C87_1551880 [compost metagenome]